MYPRSSSALRFASSSSSLPAPAPPFFFDAPLLLPALALRGGAGAAPVDDDEEEDDVEGVLAAASAAALLAHSVAACVYMGWCEKVESAGVDRPGHVHCGDSTPLLVTLTLAAAALALAAMSAKVLLLGSSCRPFSKAATAESNSLRALCAWPLR